MNNVHESGASAVQAVLDREVAFEECSSGVQPSDSEK